MASTPSRPTWIWPWRPPAALAQGALCRAIRWGGWLCRWPHALLAGGLAGALPLVVEFALGWRCGPGVTALLLVPLFAALVAHDATAHALGLLAAAFGARGVLAILLVAHDPVPMDALFADGAAYWRQTHEWLVTGESPEYELGWWLPAHGQQLAVMTFFTYTSFGWITFLQGFHETDLMNWYVGHLLAESHSPWPVLAVAWHPWSLCRGLGYLVLTFEVVSLSFQRFTGVPLSTARRRRWRWGVGLGLLVLDGVLKYTLLEPVRQVLAANLI